MVNPKAKLVQQQANLADMFYALTIPQRFFANRLMDFMVLNCK